MAVDTALLLGMWPVLHNAGESACGGLVFNYFRRPVRYESIQVKYVRWPNGAPASLGELVACPQCGKMITYFNIAEDGSHISASSWYVG